VCADSGELQDLELLVAQLQVKKAAFPDQVGQFGRCLHDNKCAQRWLVQKSDRLKQTFCHSSQSCIKIWGFLKSINEAAYLSRCRIVPLMHAP